MRLNIRVQPNAKQNKLIEEEGRLKVYLAAPPVEGKANRALIDFLVEHYKVKRSQVKIIKGLKSRDKCVIIET